MLGVCFRRENDGRFQDQWSFVFSNFGITDIWERGGCDDDYKIYQPTTYCDLADQIPFPTGRKLVVLQAQDGRYLQGNESLVDFTHPEDAVYLFGASDLNLSIEDDFGAKEPDHLVYIPTIEHEMYSFSAGYITLYDRFVKRGGFG